MKPAALVIENDRGTSKLLDVLLARLGVEADVVDTTTDALLLLERIHYDFAFVDLLLPDGSGADLLQWMAATRPEMLGRSAVLSSAPQLQLDLIRNQWPEVRVIRKPFELGEIIEAAQHAVAVPARRSGSIEEEFARRSVRAGAKAGIVISAASRTHLLPLLSFGYAQQWIERFFPLSVDEHLPLCISYRDGQPMWIPSLTRVTLDYPSLVPIFQSHQSRALACVPLLRDAVPFGAAVWSFRETHLFTEPERQIFTTIAELLAETFGGGGQSALRAHA